MENDPGSKGQSNEGFEKDDGIEDPKQEKEASVAVKVIPEHSDGKSWNPYKTAKRELPYTFFMPSPYYKLRWKILGFFHRRIFSIWDHCITLGEALVLLAIVGIAAAASALSCCDTESTGGAASFPLLFVFVLSSKYSILTFITDTCHGRGGRKRSSHTTGVPYERLLMYHKFVVIVAVLMGGYHGLVSFLGEGHEGEGEHRGGHGGEEDEESGKTISGLVLLGAMALMCVFSFYYVRKFFYEFFYRLHVILAVVVIVFCFIHGAGLAAIGVVFWGIDVSLKVLIMAYNYRWSKNCKVQGLPGNVVKIEFRKNSFRYRTGQHVMLCVPRISPFEWHLSHPSRCDGSVAQQ